MCILHEFAFALFKCLHITSSYQFIFAFAGRRACPGESLAKMEFYIFLVTIMQKYDFRAPDGVKLTDEGNQGGIVHIPMPYKLIFSVRS